MTTVCLSFDFDAVSIWVSTFKQTTGTPITRGEFSALVGLPRVLDVLAKKEVPATFFVPAHTAASFNDQSRRILDEGHEIALHGYCHEAPVGMSREDESDHLDRSIEKLRRSLGTDFAPLGYRSPAFDLSVNSVELLEERGLLYDSSMMASDFVPYRMRRGDWADEHEFHRGRASNLIEIPVAWELDDFPYFSFLNRPLYHGLRGVEDVFQVWKAEFDYCHRSVEEGVFTLTMHPEIIGRGPRIEMLGRLVDHMKASPGVSFSTIADEARRQDGKLGRAAT